MAVPKTIVIMVLVMRERLGMEDSDNGNGDEYCWIGVVVMVAVKD